LYIYGGLLDEELSAYSERLRQILSRPHLQTQAREVGFCKRESKLSPALFFDLLFYCSTLKEEISLSQMVVYLKDRHQISLRKQSLDERFTDKCVAFIKTVLQELLEENLKCLYPQGLLRGFSRVRIKDSTRFKVPSNLSNEFKPCGGRPGRFFAGASIQYEYDLISGKILDLSIHSSSRNDRRDAIETAGEVEENDLTIRDLGYFGIPVLKSFIDKNAYFVSRLDSMVSVFDEKGSRVSFHELYHRMQKWGLDKMELPVLIGENDKLALRLIVSIVPQEVYEKRIREGKKNNESRGRGCTISEETRLRYRFNLFITNASQEQLAMDKVYPVYRLRWQIELMFKCWKSIFGIAKMGGKMKKARLLCFLYVKLLLIVINLQLVYKMQQLHSSHIQKRIDKGEKVRIPVLSLCKALKTLRYFSDKLFNAVQTGKEETEKIISEIQEILSRNHFIELRKNRMGFVELLELFICK